MYFHSLDCLSIHKMKLIAAHAKDLAFSLGCFVLPSNAIVMPENFVATLLLAAPGFLAFYGQSVYINIS